MKQFDHFLITRFNLNFNSSGWDKDKNQNQTLTDEWMLFRIDIFKNYCLPSVCNQTNKNFKWIIFCDVNSKEVHKNVLEELVKDFTFIYIIYISGANFTSEYILCLRSILTQDLGYIITTRIDNDDVIHEQFVEKIQNNFNYQVFMAVNFVKFYTLSIIDFKKFKIDYAFSSHFISIIEKYDKLYEIQGCYSKGDRYWNTKGRIIQLTDDIYCMELIHDQNVLNVIRGFPILFTINLSKFQIYRNIKRSIFSFLGIFSIKVPWRKWLLLKLRIY